MPKLSFRWNVPYLIDPDECECTVEFWYEPGNGKQHLHEQDPDRSDPAVEEVMLLLGDSVQFLDELHPEYHKEVLDACWGHVEDYVGDQPREE